VLQQVVQGKSTRQIAADLGIAFKTAACHRANLMAKLDVHETASLVRRAIELKLV
jgi:FixJ family two-component response regulator